MRKLAMLLAMVLVVNTALPAATVHAAPVADETIITEGGNSEIPVETQEETEGGDPTESPTAEATAEPTAEATQAPTAEATTEPTAEATTEPTAEPTTEATEEPTAEPTTEATEEPTAEPTEEPTAEATVEPTEEPTAEATVEPTEEPTVEPTTEPTEEPTTEPEEGPEQIECSSYEVPVKLYQKNGKYPLYAIFQLPSSKFQTEPNLQLVSLEVKVDDNEEVYTCDVTRAVQGYLTYGIYVEDLAQITEGEHQIHMSLCIKDGETEYLIEESATADFVKEVDNKTVVYTEETGSIYTPCKKQYMSNAKGDYVKLVCNYFMMLNKDEDVKTVTLRHHDTKKVADIKTIGLTTDRELQRTDIKYNDFHENYSNVKKGLFDQEYVCKVNFHFQLNENLAEGDYDIVYETTAGRTIIMESRYTATSKTVIYDTRTVNTVFKTRNFDGTFSGVPVYYDNGADYVSVFVYGLNVNKNNIPVFYDTTGSSIIAEYDAADKMCHVEEWELGIDVTLKKKNMDIWQGYDRIQLPMQVSGDVIYAEYASTETAEDGIKFYYSTNPNMAYRSELNKVAGYYRLYFSPAHFSEGDIIEIVDCTEAPIQSNGHELYVEFLKGTEPYEMVSAPNGRVSYRLKGYESGYFYDLAYDRPDAKYLSNITVPANCSWEIHPARDVGNILYSGKTTEKKAVLTKAQVNELANLGAVRVCIYNAKGNVIEDGRYYAYLGSEKVYNLTYELNGGTNNPNPSIYKAGDDFVLQAPEKEGYLFLGWYKDAKFTKKITKISSTTTGDMKLYAKWKVIKATVIYDPNGASGDAVEVSHKPMDTFIFGENTFTRTGYTFVGWGIDPEGTNYYFPGEYFPLYDLQDGDTVTFYAYWVPNTYTLILEANADNFVCGAIQGNESGYILSYGDSHYLSDQEYTRADYVISSWNTKADGTGTTYKKGYVKNLTTENNGTVTLYAQWKAKEYNLYYAYKGGSVAKANPKTYTHLSDDIKLNEPTKKGYVFEGYYLVDPDSEFFTEEEEKVSVIPSGSRGDMTLYAKFRPIQYTIRFVDTTGASYGEGFNEESCDVEMNYGDMLTFTDNLYAKYGYSITSWNSKKDGSGKKYIMGRGYSNLTTQDGAVITVYAQWKKDTYKISYALNGGKNNSANPKTYTVTTKNITLKDPTRTGYIFEGWFIDSGDGQLSTAPVKMILKGSTGNMNLVAVWTPMQYELQLDPNTSKYLDEEDKVVKSLGTVDYDIPFDPSQWNEMFVPADTPENKGVGIVYWSTKANGTGTKYYPGKVYTGLKKTGTLKLYAQWGKEKYTVDYHFDESLGKVTNDNPATFTYKDSATVTLKDAKKTGYVFEGWFRDELYQDEVEVIDRSICEDVVLYGKFRPVNYVINLFDKTGATPQIITAKYGESIVLSSTFTKENYEVSQWTTKANGTGKKYTDGASYKNLATTDNKVVKLYAKWTPVKYGITYVYADGTDVVNKNPATYTYGKKVIELKNPTKKGYVFKGWYDIDPESPEFTEAEEAPAKVKKLTKKTSGNVVLYADWEPIKYKLWIYPNAKNATSDLMDVKNPVQSFVYDEYPCPDLQNIYKREGYVIKEFNTKANGRGKSYSANYYGNMPVTKQNSEVKLYTIWEKVKTKPVTGVEINYVNEGIGVIYRMNAGCEYYQVEVADSLAMNGTIYTVHNDDILRLSMPEENYCHVRVREMRYDSCGKVYYGEWSEIVSMEIFR